MRRVRSRGLCAWRIAGVRGRNDRLSGLLVAVLGLEK